MKENPRFKGVLIDENDQPVPGTEFIGWNSRSVAVTVIFCDNTHQWFLLEKRGPGCPDNIGKYCMPCGYLNWDETLAEAACRELYEETGWEANPKDMKVFGINDSVKENRQNVTVRHLYDKLSKADIETFIKNGTINCNSQSRGGEGGECSEIRLIHISEINNYDFAFNHKNIILSVAEI